MSPTQMIALAVRLFGIWFVVYWARWWPYAVTQVRESGVEMVGLVIATALIVVAARVMWFFPRTIARSILPGSDSPPVSATPPTTWFAVGCALLGLWVMTEAVPALMQNLFILFYAKRESVSLPGRWGSDTLYYVVEFAMGLWLLLGAAGVRKLLSWVRDADAAQ